MTGRGETMKRFKGFLFSAVFLLTSLPVTAYAVEGEHWYDAFSWFGDIANFIKYLFVPSENYFHNRLSKLNGLCNQKFGGLAQLYQTLNDFFGKLSNPAPASLDFTIPDNFFWQGYSGFSMNFLQSAGPYLNLLRSVLTAAFFLLTVIVCYHKIRTFFTEEEG